MSVLRSSNTMCRTCGGALGRPGYLQCRACYTGARPTPVRTWCKSQGIPLAGLAQRSHLSRHTVMRAAAGRPLSLRTARQLARVTGLELGRLVVGEGDDDGRTGGKRGP